MKDRITKDELHMIFGDSIPTDAFWMALKFDNNNDLVPLLRKKLIEFQVDREYDQDFTKNELEAMFPNKTPEEAKEVYFNQNAYTRGIVRMEMRRIAAGK